MGEQNETIQQHIKRTDATAHSAGIRLSMLTSTTRDVRSYNDTSTQQTNQTKSVVRLLPFPFTVLVAQILNNVYQGVKMKTAESDQKNQQKCKHCGRIVGCNYRGRKHKCNCGRGDGK